jgi:hypothetical protein
MLLHDAPKTAAVAEDHFRQSFESTDYEPAVI